MRSNTRRSVRPLTSGNLTGKDHRPPSPAPRRFESSPDILHGNIPGRTAPRPDCLPVGRIAKHFLAGTKGFAEPDITEAPLIVFINSRSGGRAGPKLTEILYQSLGHSQVRHAPQPQPRALPAAAATANGT